jgi:hypothetical protein
VSYFKTLAPGVALLVVAVAAYADRPHHAPPQAAIDACTNAKAGAACTFTRPSRDGSGNGHTITGTCVTPPEQTVLACKPDHPAPHGDHPPPE